MNNAAASPSTSKGRKAGRVVGRVLLALLTCAVLGVGVYFALRPTLVRRAVLPRLTLEVPALGAKNVSSLMAVSISPDGKIIAGAERLQYNRRDWQRMARVFLWDAGTGRLLRTIPAHREAVTNVEFSPDGQSLLSVGVDNVVKVWNADTGTLLWSRPTSANYFQSPRFAPDGTYVAAQIGVVGMTAWNAKTGQPHALHISFPPVDTLHWDLGDANFALSPDGILLAAPQPQRYVPDSDHDGHISGGAVGIWSLRTGRLLHVLPGARTHAIAFSSDGQRVASVNVTDTAEAGNSTPSYVQVCDVQTGRRIWSVSYPQRMVTSVIFVPGTHTLAALSIYADCRVDVLNTDTGERQHTLSEFAGSRARQFSGTAYGLAVSADGRMLISRDSNRALVWDVSSLH